MWKMLVDWVMSLFKKSGTMQTGSGNQAVTGTTSGANSPVMMVGGNVHWNVSAPSAADEDRVVFAELEEKMPEVLGGLRRELAKHPFRRDIIVLDRKTIAYTWPDDHWTFSEDENPGARSKIRVLAGYGLVEELKDRFAYRITEPFGRYLRK